MVELGVYRSALGGVGSHLLCAAVEYFTVAFPCLAETSFAASSARFPFACISPDLNVFSAIKRAIGKVRRVRWQARV